MTARRRWLLIIGASTLAAIALALGLSYRQAEADSHAAEIEVASAASVRHLLAPADFPAGAIGEDFGVANPSTVAFMVGGRLSAAENLDAAIPHVAWIQVQGEQPRSFALDADGALLAVTDAYFGLLDEQGKVGQAVPLPYPGMRLAPAQRAGAIYLFGGADGDWRLYRFLADGGLQVVLRADQPIVAVADSGKDIYAATAGVIMRIRPGTPEMLFAAPQGWQLRSLAVAEDGQVFFSTQDKVYALLGPNAISIVNDAGGSLRVRDGALYVLDPRRRLLFDLRPASSQLFKEILR
ncbi:MAG: hypothetical protein NT117_03185 [Gammaproteobacteria bacterium]|nr:hypothetical protein [Gammaproteobacteria bacterium]